MKFDAKSGKMIGKLERMTAEDMADLREGLASGRYYAMSTHPADLAAVIENTKICTAMSEEERKALMLEARRRALEHDLR